MSYNPNPVDTIYFKVECKSMDGLKTHIGTIGRKTLCGIQSRYPHKHYGKITNIDDIDDFLSSDLDICQSCKDKLPSS